MVPGPAGAGAGHRSQPRGSGSRPPRQFWGPQVTRPTAGRRRRPPADGVLWAVGGARRDRPWRQGCDQAAALNQMAPVGESTGSTAQSLPRGPCVDCADGPAGARGTQADIGGAPRARSQRRGQDRLAQHRPAQTPRRPRRRSPVPAILRSPPAPRRPWHATVGPLRRGAAFGDHPRRRPARSPRCPVGRPAAHHEITHARGVGGADRRRRARAPGAATSPPGPLAS